MKKILISLISVFAFLPVCYASDLSQLSFNQINKSHGLSDDIVYSIYQDRGGYIWIGTSNGLNRYDGYNFKKFFNEKNDPDSISSNVISWIYEDRDGYILAATRGTGISRFDPETHTFMNYDGSSLNPVAPESLNLVNHINCDSAGKLWISTQGGGLVMYDPSSGSTKNFTHDPGNPESINSNTVMSTFEDSNGMVWVATFMGGLNVYSRETGLFRNIPFAGGSDEISAPKQIHTLLEDAEKNLWIGTVNDGLIKYDRASGHFRVFGLEPGRVAGLRDTNVNIIYSDPLNNNLIWIGTEKGLYIYRIHDDRFLRYSNRDSSSGLSSDYVWCITRDRSGLLWIGTIGGGINVEKRGSEYLNNFSVSGAADYRLSSDEVRAIIPDQRNPEKIWAGTFGGGLNAIDTGSGRINPYLPEMKDNGTDVPVFITSLASSPTDPASFFIGTGSGLFKFITDENRFVKIEFRKGDYPNPGDLRIASLLATDMNGGHLWMGTYGGGLYGYSLKNNEISNYIFETDYRNITSMNRVYSMIRSGKDPDVLWLGTGIGLGKFSIRNGSIRIFSIPEKGISNGRTSVISVHEQENNPEILWLGTLGRGLQRFDTVKESFTSYTEDEGLADNRVVSIAEEPRGHLWLGTLNGISRFGIRSGFFRNFDRHEGLQNSRLNYNASHITAERKIFFGGSRGIDVFSVDNLVTNMIPPPVVLTGLKIFGSSELPGMEKILKKDISMTEEIVLPYIYNSVTIGFAALDYTAPLKNQFLCKLEGIDRDWKYIGTRNSASYRDLAPGTYTFRVKGSNSDTVWNEKGRELRIIIKNSFTGTFFFKIIIILTFLILVLLILYQRKQLKKFSPTGMDSIEKLILERSVTEREAEIIRLVLEGKSNKEIEEELFISLGTVKNHLYNIYKKLGINSRSQLISIFSNRRRE